MDLTKLVTEKRNPKTMALDEMSIEEALEVMNQEDQRVPLAIKAVLPELQQVIEATIKAFQQGGRLIYMGAGTSGRLGVLDAAECVPTFGTEPSEVIGLIAGGDSAMTVAVEGAEDSLTLGPEDLTKLKLNETDMVIGIAASGRTPYVIGALDYARSIGATTATIACNPGSEISKHADYPVEVACGPEFLTGSTRLKAGTAQKLMLNMISTISMIGIGKVYRNLMVDVRATNEKLVERTKRIVMIATGTDEDTALAALAETNNVAKVAIVMILADCSANEAQTRLKNAEGFVGKAIK